MLNTQQLQTARRIAIAAILFAVALWAWRHDRYAARFAVHGATICLAIGFFGYLYTRCLTKVVSGNRLRYRITGLFALSTAVALLAAAGHVWDALTIASLILYTVLCGPLWSRFLSGWAANDFTNAIWTSSAIVSSFIVVLTGVSTLVVIFVPQPFWSSTPFYWAMASTLYVSMEFIWHDEADTASQFVLYGLPFGLMLNIVVGLLAGATLGLVAHLLRTPPAND